MKLRSIASVGALLGGLWMSSAAAVEIIIDNGAPGF